MQQTDRYDDAVIGAGILGLAHAYHLALRGRRVVVLERDPAASGASVRNFGMLWPIGQPVGAMRDLAIRSLAIWRKVLAEGEIWHDPCGSLHLAYHEDEAQVLREFAEQGTARGEPLGLLVPYDIARRAPLVRRDQLILGLWSPTEVCVDPREVVARLPAWLAGRFGVTFRFDDPVIDVGRSGINAVDGRVEAERVWVCSGDETRALFPGLLRASGLVRCKLQMMRSHPMGDEGRIGPMLAGGLTLRHYAAFRDCPGLGRLKERIAREAPWLDRHGIHVMVSQNGRGEWVIGDSHEYGAEIGPFDGDQIEQWILDYLGTFLDVSGVRIASRWHGTYAKHPDQPYVILAPCPGVLIITGVGGAGMTLSFGLAEKVVEQVLGPA
jgi:D-hydroxyproline dehydrogenase subunit beta